MRGMLFSAKATYACIAMLELAARYEEAQPVRLKAIADTHGISQRFLVQILLQLKGAGLVVSTRGASGGYQLAMPPEKISLAAIVDLIDRTEPVQTPSSPEKLPPTPMVQVIHGVWAEILAAQQKILETTTLAELVSRSQASFDLSYQI